MCLEINAFAGKVIPSVSNRGRRFFAISFFGRVFREHKPFSLDGFAKISERGNFTYDCNENTYGSHVRESSWLLFAVNRIVQIAILREARAQGKGIVNTFETGKGSRIRFWIERNAPTTFHAIWKTSVAFCTANRAVNSRINRSNFSFVSLDTDRGRLPHRSWFLYRWYSK